MSDKKNLTHLGQNCSDNLWCSANEANIVLWKKDSPIDCNIFSLSPCIVESQFAILCMLY